MKPKLFYCVTLILLFAFGCSEMDFDGDYSVNQNQKIESNPKFNVSLSSVQAFVEILNKDVDGILRKEVETIQPIDYLGDTLLYLVNYKEDKGWVVISGDKRTTAILAYSDKGSLNLNTLKNQPGPLVWADDMAESIYALKKRSVSDADTTSADYNLWSKIEAYTNDLPVKSMYAPPGPPTLNPEGHWELVGITSEEISPTQVGPLLQTKWGQNFPWNACVPLKYNSAYDRCPTGCVAVAGAQMLYYLHYLWGIPASMYSSGYCNGWAYDANNFSYSFGFSNANTTTWDEMPTNSEKVAVLMGYIGSSIGMQYTPDQSSASTSDLVGLFSVLGINCNYTDFNSSSVVASLNNNLPVIVRANATQNDHTFLGLFHLYYTYDRGHAWVIDGYENIRSEYTYTYEWVYDEPPPVNVLIPVPPRKTETSIVSTPSYFIMNWGWEGFSDSGRYLFNESWNDFQYQKKMIINYTHN
jgi:hypothetical protein